MSIFVRIGSDGAENRYLRIRGMYGTVGRDVQGSITAGSDASPLFTVFCSPTAVAIRVEQSARLPGGERLEPGSIVWRAPPVTLRFEDTEVEIATTSTAAEGLAEVGAPAADDYNPDTWPVVSYAIAGMTHEYLLPPRIPLTIGASADAPVRIPLDSIADEHARVEFDGVTVKLTPVGGACVVEGRTIETPENLEGTTSVSLGASGFLLTIRLRA